MSRSAWETRADALHWRGLVPRRPPACCVLKPAERGRQLVSVKGPPQKLEVGRSYVGLFKGL